MSVLDGAKNIVGRRIIGYSKEEGFHFKLSLGDYFIIWVTFSASSILKLVALIIEFLD